MYEKPYPLADHPSAIRAASGRPLDTIAPDTHAGELGVADMQISAETLRAQAKIAGAAGYTQLAANLARAAELTAVPNDELLRIYDALRPGRATHADLLALAERLEREYDAPQNAALVREAAAAYKARGLI